jgi:23S rRNA pseudouridine1911/1915/1917 synthase
MAAKSLEQGGREAISHYTVIEQFDHHALLNVIIETGRTHQIRVHMFALGHTVVGDRLYKTRKAKPDGFPRLFLHASELTITLPSGEEQSFEAPLPQELQSYLKTL